MAIRILLAVAKIYWLVFPASLFTLGSEELVEFSLLRACDDLKEFGFFSQSKVNHSEHFTRFVPVISSRFFFNLHYDEIHTQLNFMRDAAHLPAVFLPPL